MFSCNLHEFSGFGDACPKCLKELAERHASKTESEFPTNPAAPEWDGFSAKHIGMKFQSSLGVCELMAIDSNNVTCCVRFVDSGHLQFCSLDALEPIRTKEQRQKEELSDLITDNIKVDYTDGNFYIDDDKAVNAIIAAGWRKD